MTTAKPLRRPVRSLPPDYFARKYAADLDPWRFASSAYEADKYARTLAALPRAHYRSALEIGCSIGVLTAALAARCDRLLALDVVESALDQARRRCAHLPQVRFERRQVPAEYPAGGYDLVLVSEVGYYLCRADLDRLVGRICASLEVGGHLLLVHWTPDATDYPLTGDEVHERVLATAGDALAPVRAERAATWRLDLLARQPAR